MTPALTASRLATTYPSARVRGRLITRQEERSLGWAVLDAARAEYLGREGLGWLVGGHPGVRPAAAQLGRLDANPEGGVWVVVPVSGELTQELFALWPHREHVTALASGPPRGGRGKSGSSRPSGCANSAPRRGNRRPGSPG